MAGIEIWIVGSRACMINLPPLNVDNGNCREHHRDKHTNDRPCDDATVGGVGVGGRRVGTVPNGKLRGGGDGGDGGDGRGKR